MEGRCFSRYTGGVFSLLFLIKISLCVALDVRINENTNLHSTLFNASLPTNHWVYSFDVVRSPAWTTRLLRLDSATGAVTLAGKVVPCDPRIKYVHNTIVIDAFHSIDKSTIRLPLNIYYESIGRCDFLRQNKFKSSSRRLNIGISSTPTAANKLCFEPQSTIAHIQNFIPISLSNECEMYFEVKSSKHFTWNDNNKSIYSDSQVCVEPLTSIAKGIVLFVCPESSASLPIKVVLKASSKVIPSFIWHTVESGSSMSRVRRQSGGSNSPTFSQHVYVFHVAEEQLPGIQVGFATIDDADQHEVQYSILANRNSESQHMFEIDATTGELRTLTTLDRESIASHQFQLSATDLQDSFLTGTANLNIFVTDINDHSPVFEDTIYRSNVLEGHSSRTTILTVRAIDEDEGINANIEYSIVNQAENNGKFEIDPRLGIIRPTSALDREEVALYTLQIQATDMASDIADRRMATATVEITVLDANDNKPQFSQGSYTFDVSENIDTSYRHVIGEIRATDIDEGHNSIISYSITGGNTLNVFDIDSVSGQLLAIQPLDYEQTSTYHLQIKAQDNGSPPKSNSTQVLVRVVDMNDNAPYFPGGLQIESIHEDEPIGYTIAAMQGLDRDSGANGELIYSIQQGSAVPENLPFSIDQHTGIIQTFRHLDRETHDNYEFTVLARDQGSPSRTGSTSVQIRVLDTNDNAPIFNPRIYYAVVSEEEHEGFRVDSVTATDEDTEAHSRIVYTIYSGNDRNAFRIAKHGGVGNIFLTRQLNYREESHYRLSIRATDSGDHTDTAVVYVNVTDANNFRPIFRNVPYLMRVMEDVSVGASVFRVTATDNDIGENARITYSLGDNDVFQINPVTGNITVREPLDRESVAGYSLSVTAVDHGRPSKSDTTDIEVLVIDVNDNSPIFEQDIFNGNVREDALVGTSILTITARDADEALNGNIRYTFENGYNGMGDFMLDPTLGVLRTAQELDRERVNNYELRAYAIDRGNPERSTSVVINVIVEDVNDNAPQFESQRITLSILENSPIGSTVDRVIAVDPDDSINAEVVYSIVNSPDMESFSLVTEPDQTAVIITNTELDYESGKKSYNLKIRARSDNLLSDADVVIEVVDVNDNQPQLEDFTVVFNNFQNHFPTGNIGRIPASDPDVNDELEYRFISGNTANYLHLDEATGLIRLHSKLNSDVPANATLHVAVTDGLNEVRALCHLSVRLVTEAMLFNSITVRLDQLSQSQFISSPLYTRFLSALASIIPAAEQDVFLFNVQDDTDADEDQTIVNVSFSVRKRMELNEDVFYSQQFLRERVYLQRTLLARLSTLEVLPFDDNLCVVEPCLNYEKCVSVLRFGNASDFISSTSMLFRPIHPINAFDCSCPAGFTGMETEYLCDTEVNLCYSSPCGGNGTCLQHEGGYTCDCHRGYAGENCEFSLSDKGCSHDLCKSGSHCSPLILGGFRCELCPRGDVLRPGSSPSQPPTTQSPDMCSDCSDLAHHTRFCELTTRSFSDNTFLLFPSLNRRHRFNIKLQFATRQPNGLLFYNGRYNEMHDFIALELIDGQPQFSFSLGSEVTRVQAHIDGGVADGDWHTVNVDYYNRTVTLSIGEWCDTEVAVRYGYQINYTCAVRATQILEPRCDVITEACHRFLDLTGPFQIGGLPSLSVQFQVENTRYVGCMRDVYIDGEFLDLNDYVWNNGTVPGCAQKKMHCQPGTCHNNGVCREVWDTFQCECTTGWGGIDCSQVIDGASYLSGESYLQYTEDLPGIIQLPWYNAVEFRTRSHTALLMYIELNAVQNTHVRIEIVNGLIHYIHTQQTVILDNVHVNDGKWHYLETRWLASELIITLDYGLYRKQSPMDDWVVGLSVAQVYVGGQRHQSSNIVLDGLVGCIKNVRLGSSANARLHDPVEHNIEPGCHVEDACRADVGLCPQHSFCVDLWADHQCTCQPGYIGQNCESICITTNPCHEGSTCRPDRSSSDGYVCDCPQNQYGQYCEHTLTPTCPTSWWGTPICGPCNCPRDKGFSSSCNKQTGECVCKTNHYRPEGSDTCYPCDCYNIGSHKRLCDVVTGQCRCREGVIGRKCDTCYSKFAEVTLRGCEVIYDSCPRAFSQDIWWERTVFNELAAQSCPTGATGFATRNCTSEGWLSVDKSGCLSQEFVDIQRRLLQLENGDITMNTYVSKSLMQDLEEATNRSAPLGKTKTFYLADINVTYHVVIHVLSYESRQAGLNLTHTQDRNFIQNLVTSLSRILDPDNNHLWNRMQTTDQASVNLMNALEIYSQVLAKNMAQLFTQPFDAVDDNLVLGLDYAVKSGNLSSVSVPKFNNKVLNDAMFDSNTNIEIPISVLEESGPITEPGVLAEFSYVMYRTLGGVMPKSYHESIMESDVRMILNAPIFTLNVVNGNKTLHGVVDQPVLVHFKQFQAENRSSPQCAYWKQEDSVWTSEGCSVLERQVQGSHHFITCECSHLSTFGLIMDQSNVERMESSTIAVEIITYICVIIALVCLLITLVLMCVLRGLHTNSNSIHINLIFVTFVANTLFLTGINQTHDQLGCTVVSIFLHYFFMSVFAWLFVETLHIYRMMTEIRDINHGSMKFYYVVGYVIPGIITGLAVGLSTDAYGNDEFCWLKTSDILIWSFIGPICFVIGLNIVVCAMTLRASCNSKKGDDIFARLKYLMRAVFILLPLLGASWVFALLSVNKDVLAYHYLFALFTLLQGIFIILAYVLFHKQLRQELIWRCQGKSNLDDTLGETRTGILSHSSLAYHHNNSSLEGGLNRLQFPVSTNSTTSKSSTLGGVYEGGYYPSNSTSTSGNPYVPDIQRRGYNSSSMFHDIGPNDRDMVDVSKRHKHHSHKHHNGRHAGRESDSDSELSAMEQTDMDLASSHSSDEYDNDSGRWGQRPKQKVFDRVRKQASPPQVLRIASNPLSQTPSAEPPSYNDLTPTKIPLWPGEAFSTTTISDSEGKNTPQTTPTKKPMLSPNKLNIMNSSPSPRSPRSPLSVKGSQDILIPPADRQDSLQSAVNSGSESCTDNKVKVHERDRDRVQVLTHNGSFSESEIHDLSMQDNTETTV